MARYVQKRFVKPTKIKSHTRKIGGKNVKIKSYTRKIPRVTYGYKSTTNKQYRQSMRRLAPFADADRDGVRNWDDCRPFDKNRQDEKNLPPFARDKKWSEGELRIILRRINSGKITPTEVFKNNKYLDAGEGVQLTKEQSKKGLEWLRKQHYTPTGKEKENSPFGYREIDIINDPNAKFNLKDFYSERGRFYVPLYEVSGNGSYMEYYVSEGKINIVG